MNTLDLMFRVYRARYSLTTLQRRLDVAARVAFLGNPEHTARMMEWVGELHSRARRAPVEQRTLPMTKDDWKPFHAAVFHLGESIPSSEVLRELADSVPDRIPCLFVVEGLEVELPDAPPGTLPRVLRLDPIDPGPGFARWLTRAFPSLAVSLSRDYANLRYFYARLLIRTASARAARMSLASTVKAPPLPVIGPMWRFFATTGETIALTSSQIQLCLVMAALHHRSVDFFDRMGELWPIIGGSFGWRTAARALVGLVPNLAWLSKSSVAYGGTWTIGETARLFYEHGAPKDQEVQRELRRRAQDDLLERLKESEVDPVTEAPRDEPEALDDEAPL